MSADMSFASSVALYGMIMKNSFYTGRGDYDLVCLLAKESVENMKDSNESSLNRELRGQFIDMVKTTAKLCD